MKNLLRDPIRLSFISVQLIMYIVHVFLSFNEIRYLILTCIIFLINKTHLLIKNYCKKLKDNLYAYHFT